MSHIEAESNVFGDFCVDDGGGKLHHLRVLGKPLGAGGEGGFDTVGLDAVVATCFDDFV